MTTVPSEKNSQAVGQPITEPNVTRQRMDPRISSIQPGGGICMRLELAWGRIRRWYLLTFRKRYVERMRACRQGDAANYPIPILDPRDLKYYRNQGNLSWSESDDPFAWRDRLPFVRVGLGELVICTAILGLGIVGLVWVFPWLAVIPAVLLAEVVWFFRNPKRRVPTEPGLVVAPADGRVFSIREVENDDYVGGPAVVIDVFLSIFNVHINRAPVAGEVDSLEYRPGKFLNALRPEAARENECLELRMLPTELPHRPVRVRQITGAIARRIVCWVRPGEPLSRGGQFGMIKLGSRTELTLPKLDGMELTVKVGTKVRAGTTVVARYRPTD